jgi:type I restriction enzyme S subunit
MGEGSTGQTELSRAKLGEMPILVPPKNVLTMFDAVIEPLKSRVALNEGSARSLTTLRDTLLPRLISGQLRLPDAQAAAKEALA